MTHSEKTQYTRIGLGLAGIVASDTAAETIWRVYEEIQVKKGEFSIKDATKIQADIQDRQARAQRKKKVTFEKEK